jgi:hypothetical protein
LHCYPETGKSLRSHTLKPNKFIAGRQALHCGGTDSPQAL